MGVTTRTAVIVALLGLSAPARGSTAQPAGVTVTDGWVRATPPGARTAAAYLTLSNRGAVSDRLTSSATPAAAGLEPHRMSMAGGIMRMRPITGGLALPPSASVRFQPGGDHLMLTGLKAPLKAGGRVEVSLTFQHAGLVRASLPVRTSPPAGAPASDMPGMAMH